ncbi:Pyruvate kinase [Candidatus Syntrophocurvum alkaliphilum]|uniref:Pyruvate kinase n=1 Tax=Candidatus Syntrophocurvum alkaliphilum TaxID=2293317 RepID=A0A6I6DGG2_9FIRM|nr:pyruvate kinase [Candidatus Syntrophocurvum alkaliphilum]QGU00187.1 Pyruvate kinase [Candidatus Syntrophocurvum alkaliphilum]
MRKTKIICTIGPASEKVDVLQQLINNGMNVARLNFSHGSYEEHKNRINNVREASNKQGQPVAIMLDTRGPEIRTGLLEDKKVMLESGQKFILTNRDIEGNKNEVQINYPNLPNEVSEGTSILLSDGLISLQVEQVTETDIICTVVNGGELGERKGVNVPGIRINLPFLSTKDIEDIHFGIDNEVDFIAASFVRSAEDVLEIKRILEEREADIGIIAKIESQSGVDNLEDIIKVADGVMVARGDLGVEIPAEEVPIVQNTMIEKCNFAGKIVIIATQMLDSMINNPRPTRAEVSDVANAIFSGSDAIMLSGETAAGKYPIEVVETMARIAKRAEEVYPYREVLRQKRSLETLSVTDAISYATCATAMNLGASAIITATRTGNTAAMVAKYRPQAKIIAVTPEKKLINRLLLFWGVYPVLSEETIGTDQMLEESIKQSLTNKLISNGDLVILTAGDPTGHSGGTNLLKVHVVGDILVEGMGIGSISLKGQIRIVANKDDLKNIQHGEIVVARSVESSFSPYLEKIAGLIVEEGGLTSNAAIIGIDAKIPVIVGAKDAVSILSNEMMVTMDVPSGRVYKGLAKIF